MDKNGLFGKVRVFEGKHSQDWAEIAENEEICDLHDKNGGLRFFWQLVQLNYALVSQMGCLELFIFENGQPMTTPPPKVYFWAFRLTVSRAVFYLADKLIKFQNANISAGQLP